MEYEHIVHSFEPIFDSASQILILGTLPSVKYRETNFYYGHKQNRFWKVLAALFQEPIPETIDEKKHLLLRHHIAIWDVIQSCDIKGSSDSSIKNVKPTELRKILDASNIKQIYANGSKAGQLYNGNPNASLILLQMIGDHDIEMIDHEFDLIQKAVSDELCLIACKVDDWNRDLSPWKAPAVFKSESFGENAAKTLSEVLTYIGEKKQPCIIGGYSLAGLFALWAATKTDRFSKVAAASPSVWFPGFTEYIKENNIKAKAVYLSLGDREEKTRNPVMATVGHAIRSVHETISDSGINTILEWNQGNHFKDVDIRMAKALTWSIRATVHG